MADDSDELTPKQAAGYLNLSRRTLYRLRHQGRGPVAYKIGGRIRFKIRDLDNWKLAGKDDD